MIRFSHTANSWQIAYGSEGWINIAVAEARLWFDHGALLYHEAKMIAI